MNKLRTLIKISILLGITALIALFFSHLALTDIYHGEPDPRLEWNILRVSALLFITFIGISTYTLYRVLRIAK